MSWLVIDIIAGLTRIGVNLTETQLETLKWRLSDEGKKCYTKKETNEFYKSVEKGNTDIIDVVRMEKQMKITEYKRKLGLLVIPLLVCLTLSGCRTSLPIDIPTDPSILKSNERSYSIKDQKVYCHEEYKSIEFPGIWYIVNKDFIKEHNENQDSLLKSLDDQLTLKRTNNWLMVIAGISVILMLIFMNISVYYLKKRGAS